MFLGGMLNAAKIVDPVADNLKHLLHEKMVSDSLEDEIWRRNPQIMILID